MASEVLLVASGGGHLEQLRFLADRLPFNAPRRWITFDTPQSRSLLQGEAVEHVPYMAPRDLKGLLANVLHSRAVRRRLDVEAVVSTGAGLALVYLPQYASRGVPVHYIESATRVDGPSLTGRLLSRNPKVQVHTQYQHWSNDRWNYGGSIFDNFTAIDNLTAIDQLAAIEDEVEREPRIRRAVVSLGTIRPYGFRRLIERLIELFDDDTEVIWQTGSTDVDGLPIEARVEMPHSELVSEIQSADVLVAHAGTGIALTALRAGVCPVLVPREAAHKEHVDDHQQQIAQLLNEAGLAICRPVDGLSRKDLTRARVKSIVLDSSPRRMELGKRATGYLF